MIARAVASRLALALAVAGLAGPAFACSCSRSHPLMPGTETILEGTVLYKYVGISGIPLPLAAPIAGTMVPGFAETVAVVKVDRVLKGNAPSVLVTRDASFWIAGDTCSLNVLPYGGVTITLRRQPGFSFTSVSSCTRVYHGKLDDLISSGRKLNLLEDHVRLASIRRQIEEVGDPFDPPEDSEIIARLDALLEQAGDGVQRLEMWRRVSLRHPSLVPPGKVADVQEWISARQ